jgi:hypothetical protein
MHFTEFNFGGNVPSGMVANGASDKFSAAISKLKKMLPKLHPTMMTKAT